ncbi:unnamed protein product [Cylindrotheca closterium]|uniref:PDZ domain-containing protein n=1 Tax=Cylindrotheca closterium TaxID=2856 RepID=A0AAD2GCP4_9STRA|nr:unnamed protein product [Cylindrotheca closterium]
MGQSQSCMKQDAVQEVVNRAPDGSTGTGDSASNPTLNNSNLPRLDNPHLAKEPVITQVHRRHKGARLPKQRELMVAGLQVRQQQGESIAYLLNSLPYGSIIQVESNTHLLIAQPVRRLQLAIYQNHLGNVQIATVTSQEGIVPPRFAQGQILVTVNGKSIKTVDQAVEALSVPEKLLVVMAEAPLDKKDRQQMKGTSRVVDSVLTKQDIRRSNSSLLDSSSHRPEEEKSREDRHRHHRRRRKHERRGSGSSHGSHGSNRSRGSHGSSKSRSSSRRSSSKPSSTTPLRNKDKVIPTISDQQQRQHIRRNSSNSSMSSSTNVESRGGGDNKIWVAKDSNGSNSTHPSTVDSNGNGNGNGDYDDNKKKASSSSSSRIVLNSTMDTSNTTVVSYDDSQLNDSFLVLSPTSSVASPTNDQAVHVVTPNKSVQNISKIASYDEEEHGHPLVFQTTSSESEHDDGHAGAGAAAKPADATGEDEDGSKLLSILARLDKFLDETMMELAFVMIEMEDLQHKHNKPIGDVPAGDAAASPTASPTASTVSYPSMTAEQLEALEKDLRLKMFDILEARQRALDVDHKKFNSKPVAQPPLALPTIEEQPKLTAASYLDQQVKEPPSPPPKLSLPPSASTKKLVVLEQQLLEMQNANKALKQELAHKDVQLNEFQELDKQVQQNKEVSTRIQ